MPYNQPLLNHLINTIKKSALNSKLIKETTKARIKITYKTLLTKHFKQITTSAFFIQN